MSHENPYATGTQVLHRLHYSVDSHGDLSAHFESLTNADLPRYTARFYSPTEHEQIADVKYQKIEIGYDKGLRDMTHAFQGLPLEAYIPWHAESSDTGSSSPAIKPREIVVEPSKAVISEIIKAQREAANRDIIIQEFEEIRVVRKRTIRIQNKKVFK